MPQFIRCWFSACIPATSQFSRAVCARMNAQLPIFKSIGFISFLSSSYRRLLNASHASVSDAQASSQSNKMSSASSINSRSLSRSLANIFLRDSNARKMSFIVACFFIVSPTSGCVDRLLFRCCVQWPHERWTIITVFSLNLRRLGFFTFNPQFLAIQRFFTHIAAHSLS